MNLADHFINAEPVELADDSIAACETLAESVWALAVALEMRFHASGAVDQLGAVDTLCDLARLMAMHLAASAHLDPSAAEELVRNVLAGSEGKSADAVRRNTSRCIEHRRQFFGMRLTDGEALTLADAVARAWSKGR
jgi:hypothetical protein